MSDIPAVFRFSDCEVIYDNGYFRIWKNYRSRSYIELDTDEMKKVIITLNDFIKEEENK
jgi:hypothetical protein